MLDRLTKHWYYVESSKILKYLRITKRIKGYLENTYRLYIIGKNPDSPVYVRLIAVFGVMWVVIPWDFDFVPLIGWVDDLGILHASYQAAVKLSDPSIVEKANELSISDFVNKSHVSVPDFINNTNTGEVQSKKSSGTGVSIGGLVRVMELLALPFLLLFLVGFTIEENKYKVAMICLGVPLLYIIISGYLFGTSYFSEIHSIVVENTVLIYFLFLLACILTAVKEM